MTDLRYVGLPAKRVDALEKVMGKAKYLADYRVPGMLYARALRSDVPHARITKLYVRPALNVPGVLAVITSDDFVDKGRFGFPIKDQYICAYQIVRHVGEGIAAVAAETPEAALAGVEAIELELDPLPGLFDVEHALEANAPQIGPHRNDGNHPNFVSRDIVRKGDPLAILQQCDVVLDEKYSTVQQEHAYLETEGALAIPSDEGGILVYYSGQSPFINKGILAMVLGIDPEMVRVIQPHVGGSFGGKDDLNYYSSGQVAALALKTGRPVRMTFSREESMVASYKRDAMHMHIRLGARKDGTLQACKFEATLDSGAYASQSVFTAWRASIHAMGAYRYDACNVDVVGVYTNNGYAGAFRGFGNTEVCFGIEVAVDEMADKLGVDPLDFRLRNCLRQGDETPHGQVLTESIGLADCLEQVRIKGDWDRKRREYGHRDSAEFVHGIGVSALFHGISLGAEGLDAASSTIEVHPDYSISITSGLTDYGTGSRTVFALIAAEELGVQPERVHYMLTDTDSAIDSGPTVASRSTILGGNAMRIAARKLASTLDQSAADLLGCEVAQLGREGESYFGPSEQLIDWKLVVDHARNMGLVLSAHGKWTSPAIHWDRNTGRGTPYFAYHFGAQVAEVEVDQRTGKVEITGYWAVHDLGKLLFPQGAFGQLYGAITQGIGYALLEEASFRNGYLQSTNFDTYLIPTSMDVPDIDGDFVEATLKAGPYGAKNIAEPAMPPAAPAIINAIAHATGKRIRSLPANLERVLLGYELHPNASMEPCKIGLRIR